MYGTDFCLDAGSSEYFGPDEFVCYLLILLIGPTSGVGLKIWQCFDNLQAQEWFYTDDQRISLNGTGLSVPPFLSLMTHRSFACPPYRPMRRPPKWNRSQREPNPDVAMHAWQYEPDLDTGSVLAGSRGMFIQYLTLFFLFLLFLLFS